MGIQNRDYMKRPSDDDDDRRASSSDSKAEEFLTRFLQRHPRFFIYVGVGLAALVVAAIIVAVLTNKSH
jgi:high-affinity Fe2+/Pb2+ permease